MNPHFLYFLVTCAIVTVVAIFCFAALLSCEYQRWSDFMERQRTYFRRLAHIKLKEKERERLIESKKQQYLQRIKPASPAPAVAGKKK